MVFEKIRSCFDLCISCLEADAKPNTFIKQRLLYRRDQLELFLLDEEDRYDSSLLRNWLVSGYLNLFDLFLYGWLSNVFIRDKECKQIVMKELFSLLEKCEPSSIDAESILEIAYTMARCQEAINDAFKRLESNTIN